MARKLKTVSEDVTLLLLDAARRLILEGGVQALTARKLAAACDMAPGTVYNYYKDMHGVLLAVNGQTLDDLLERLKQAARGEPNAASRPLLMANTFYNFMASQENLWECIVNFRFNGEVPSWYQDKILALIAQVTAQLPAKDPAKIDKALLLWASIQGLWLLSSRNKLFLLKEASPKRLLGVLWELFSKS